MRETVYALVASVQTAELLQGSPFSTEDLARACGVAPAWVQARLDAGVLHAERTEGCWRFDSPGLLRARRIAQLERAFDADPQLAALAADLIDEVQALRKRLMALGPADTQD